MWLAPFLGSNRTSSFDRCGFETYRIVCKRCETLLIAFIDPADDAPLISEFESAASQWWLTGGMAWDDQAKNPNRSSLSGTARDASGREQRFTKPLLLVRRAAVLVCYVPRRATSASCHGRSVRRS